MWRKIKHSSTSSNHRTSSTPSAACDVNDGALFVLDNIIYTLFIIIYWSKADDDCCVPDRLHVWRSMYVCMYVLFVHVWYICSERSRIMDTTSLNTNEKHIVNFLVLTQSCYNNWLRENVRFLMEANPPFPKMFFSARAHAHNNMILLMCIESNDVVFLISLSLDYIILLVSLFTYHQHD